MGLDCKEGLGLRKDLANCKGLNDILVSSVLSGAVDKVLPEFMMIALQVLSICFRFHFEAGMWFTLWFLCSVYVTLT